MKQPWLDELIRMRMRRQICWVVLEEYIHAVFDFTGKKVLQSVSTIAKILMCGLNGLLLASRKMSRRSDNPAAKISSHHPR